MPLRSHPILATLLLALFAWGGAGVSVVDAAIFHRLNRGGGVESHPVVGLAADAGVHATTCQLGQSLAASRLLAPPAPGLAIPPAPARASCRVELRPLARSAHPTALHSRAPPSA